MSQPASGLTPLRHYWLLKHVSDAVFFVDEDGRIVDRNVSAIRLAEKSFTNFEYIHSFLSYNSFNQLKAHNQKKKSLDLRNGRMFLYIQCLKLTNSNMGAAYCVLLQQVSKLERSHDDIHNLSTVSQEAVVLHNYSHIVECDETFARMFGYSFEELRHISLYDLVSPRQKHYLMKKLSETPDAPYELEGVKKDGSPLYVEIMAQPFSSETEAIRAAILRDVTETVQHRKQVEFLAYYDKLTDLPNRAYFMQTLQQAIMEASHNCQQLAVYFMDIDYFKQINDTMGYEFGDKLLALCAERLRFLLDEYTFIARMGGDEFLILQRNIQSKQEAERFARKIIGTFKDPVYIGDTELYTTVSIGISYFPEDGRDEQELIQHADSAMNVIKKNNRNNYKVFESSISKDFKAMLKMETDLRKALQDNQFELHYQPQKDLMSGNCVGLEALLRWNHPDMGYVSPATFIPIAEKTSLILEIGQWVLKEACRQNKEWQYQGYSPVVVAVNLSAKQFHQPDLVEQVEAILEKTRLSPRYLELEITESMAMSHEEDILQTLYELRNLGVHVSIDDFGTGYSSLKYLSRFPVSKLKIDKAFIHDAHKHNEAIVKSIINMSHSLNMKVIAEGVETREQFTFLKQELCDEMQGFYYHKPLPATHLEQVLSKLH
ncbi:EAL domain-containing protein [Pontibacillus salicampi]|uniref:EAL domain-containing protein n=1 Tax=Pontibacillus salicampi TaxID=1449801 RepID=A0ABV6LIH3_9BACI